MPRLLRLLSTTLAASLAGAVVGASPALASHSQQNFFEASNTLLNPATRARTFPVLEHLGVKALRIELYWYAVAPKPTSAAKPSFDATNPVNYDWSAYDPVLEEAHRLGWTVLLTITSPVPRWATSNHKAPYVTRPDDRDFQEFVTAVARHFGSEVSIYSIWNEPNHPAFLQPQFAANGKPASPRIYRGLYQAAYAGLQAAGLANPKVLFGETAPTGYDRVNARRMGLLHDVAPLAFLREALCLNGHYVKSRSCGPLAMSGYAHHAYTIAVRPTFVPRGSDEVMIGSIFRLTRALDLAARAHAIPAHLPLYLTEFGVQSFPNRQLGVSVGVQAERDAWAEQIAWSNPRVAAFSQYLLRDDPVGGRPGASLHGGTVGFQTGLEYSNGRPKPLYYGWPVQLSVARHGHGYSLWGLIRPSAGATRVTILVKARHARKYRTLTTVTTNPQGYWALRSSFRGEVWRVRWVSPAGVRYDGAPVRAH
jgi:hypothetical protein